jgi:hypothetical protein
VNHHLQTLNHRVRIKTSLSTQKRKINLQRIIIIAKPKQNQRKRTIRQKARVKYLLARRKITVKDYDNVRDRVGIAGVAENRSLKV